MDDNFNNNPYENNNQGYTPQDYNNPPQQDYNANQYNNTPQPQDYNTNQYNNPQQGYNHNNTGGIGNDYTNRNQGFDNQYAQTYGTQPPAHNQNDMYSQYNNNNPQPQDYPNYDQQAPQNKKAFGIASLVLGICSIVFCCCTWWLPLILAVLSVVFGIISIKKNENARGLAIAGFITSGVAILFVIIATVAGQSIIAQAGGSDADSILRYIESLE